MTPRTMKKALFRVADAIFSTTFSEDSDFQLLSSAYTPFAVSENEESNLFCMTIGEGLVDYSAEGEEIGQFDCGGINHGVYARKGGGFRFLISNGSGQPACAFNASANFSECEISIFGTQADRSLGLNNAIMIAYAFSGARHNILLMHSSVALNGGKGYMFLGKSGTGKSTHSLLWGHFIEGTSLLNDDNPAIRYFPETEKAIVYGTPWSGKTPCYRNLSAPIGGIVRLRQWPENIIHRESKVQAFASILSSCSTMMWDKPSYDAIIRTVNQVIAVTPVYYLQCRPDEEAAHLSYKTIAR